MGSWQYSKEVAVGKGQLAVGSWQLARSWRQLAVGKGKLAVFNRKLAWQLGNDASRRARAKNCLRKPVYRQAGLRFYLRISMAIESARKKNETKFLAEVIGCLNSFARRRVRLTIQEQLHSAKICGLICVNLREKGDAISTTDQQPATSTTNHHLHY